MVTWLLNYTSLIFLISNNNTDFSGLLEVKVNHAYDLIYISASYIGVNRSMFKYFQCKLFLSH